MLSMEAMVSLVVILMFVTAVSVTFNALHRDTLIYQHMLLNDILESYYKSGGFAKLSYGDFTVIHDMEKTADAMGYTLVITPEVSWSDQFTVPPLEVYGIRLEFTKDLMTKIIKELAKKTGLDKVENYQISSLPSSECANKPTVSTTRVVPSYMGYTVKLRFTMCPK